MFGTLDALLGRGGPHEVIEVLQHEPPRELVAPHDFTRVDQLGRTVVACPRGMAPASHLKLTDAERASLVPAAPSPPAGYLHPNGLGFSPEGVVVGYTSRDSLSAGRER